jgi:hypothetical protein
MQDLGRARPHARTQPGGEYHRGEGLALVGYHVADEPLLGDGGFSDIRSDNTRGAVGPVSNATPRRAGPGSPGSLENERHSGAWSGLGGLDDRAGELLFGHPLEHALRDLDMFHQPCHGSLDITGPRSHQDVAMLRDGRLDIAAQSG